jgi:hypothetical protein
LVAHFSRPDLAGRTEQNELQYYEFAAGISDP